MSSGYSAYIQPSDSIEQWRKTDDDRTNERSWKGKLWDTFDLPPAERKLLHKVDAVVLTFASLGYFVKSLDQQNVNSAFLSGMKEDLGMYGNQLVTAVTIWTIGYVIGQIPSNMLLTRLEPRIVIPALELGWGLATLASYNVKSYQSLYVMRFLVGLFESGFYPGIHYVLGSWYTPRELGKRAMIFWLAGTIGGMCSGVLQAAAYDKLGGLGGLAGWRWLFIIDAVITLPIALAGFIFFPSAPLQDKKAWWLTREEHELSKNRMRGIGRAGRKPWTRVRIKNLLRDWHFYFLPILYVIWNNGGAQSAMGYWLKSFNDPENPPVPGKTFSIAEINQLPIPGKFLIVVNAIAYAWLSDGPFKGRRYPFIYSNAIVAVLFGMIFVKLDLYRNVNKTMILYWLSDLASGAGPLILTWINEMCSDDTEKRALLVAMGNELAYLVQSIVPNFVWKTTDFPEARAGWTYTIFMNVALVVWTTLILLLLRRDAKQALRNKSSTSLDSVYTDEEDVVKPLYSPEYLEDVNTAPTSRPSVEIA